MEVLQGTSLMMMSRGVWTSMSVAGRYDHPVLYLDIGRAGSPATCSFHGEVTQSGESIEGTATCTFDEDETWEVDFQRL